jgi:hypothetical protein
MYDDHSRKNPQRNRSHFTNNKKGVSLFVQFVKRPAKEVILYILHVLLCATDVARYWIFVWFIRLGGRGDRDSKWGRYK